MGSRVVVLLLQYYQLVPATFKADISVCMGGSALSRTILFSPTFLIMTLQVNLQYCGSPHQPIVLRE